MQKDETGQSRTKRKKPQTHTNSTEYKEKNQLQKN